MPPEDDPATGQTVESIDEDFGALLLKYEINEMCNATVTFERAPGKDPAFVLSREIFRAATQKDIEDHMRSLLKPGRSEQA